MTSISTLELRVLPRPDHDGQRAEVVILLDGAERLARLGRDGTAAWIGRDPAVLFGNEAPLAADLEPHDAFVARCSPEALAERSVFAVRSGSILRDLGAAVERRRLDRPPDDPAP